MKRKKTRVARTIGLSRFKQLTEEEQQENIAKFKANNPKLWSMLEEIRERIPWQKNIVQDLVSWAKRKGELTDKQKGLVTSLYMDCCVTSDRKIREQQDARKLCYRLLELGSDLGQIRKFVFDVSFRTDGRSFSPGQLRAINNIANKLRRKLADIPKLTDETFDGWFSQYVDETK